MEYIAQNHLHPANFHPAASMPRIPCKRLKSKTSSLHTPYFQTNPQSLITPANPATSIRSLQGIIDGTTMSAERGEVTRLLGEYQHGDAQAMEKLLPLVYDELRRLAASYFRRERKDHTLQPTALVHEVYMKLVDQRSVEWQSRGHFLSMAATLMRRVLVDHARSHEADKRGGGGQKVLLDENIAAAEERELDAIALDAALTRLERLDPEQARIVELRFFGGLSVDEVASIMKISPATVKRYWASAKAWLYRELAKGAAASG